MIFIMDILLKSNNFSGSNKTLGCEMFPDEIEIFFDNSIRYTDSGSRSLYSIKLKNIKNFFRL